MISQIKNGLSLWIAGIQKIFTHPLLLVYTAAYVLLNILFYPIALGLSDIAAYLFTGFVTFSLRITSTVVTYIAIILFLALWGLIGVIASEIFIVSSLWYYRTLRHYLPSEHHLTLRPSASGLSPVAYMLASLLFLHRVIMLFAERFEPSTAIILVYIASIGLPLLGLLVIIYHAYIFLLYDSYHESYTHLYKRAGQFLYKHLSSHLTIVLCTALILFCLIMLNRALLAGRTVADIPVITRIVLAIGFIAPILIIITGYFVAKTNLYLQAKEKN